MTIHKCQSLTLRKAVVYLSNVFASGQAYVALSRVRTRDDLFIQGWKLRGLLNVKKAIQTRLTKESEDARTAIDDKIDELEERIANGSGAEVEGLDDGREIRVVERWEDIRNVAEWITALMVESDDRASNQMWNSDMSDATSVSASDLSSSYESDVESVSRVPQKYELSSASECSEDGESDRSPDSDNEAPSDDGLSDIVETEEEEPAISKTLSGTEFSIIRSEKRKHY
ncbi:hypothetical protein BGZ92_006147, partial [Podila epicladia]